MFGFVEDIINGILEVLLLPITPILEPISRIAALFEKIFEFLMSIMLMFPKILDIFFYITDPRKLMNDLIFGVVKGFYMVIDAIMDTLFGDLRRSMGNKQDKGSNNGSASLGNEKCIPPSMVEILLLVLCPPLAIILKKGISGLFYVIICSILTYFYYILLLDQNTFFVQWKKK